MITLVVVFLFAANPSFATEFVYELEETYSEFAERPDRAVGFLMTTGDVEQRNHLNQNAKKRAKLYLQSWCPSWGGVPDSKVCIRSSDEHFEIIGGGRAGYQANQVDLTASVVCRIPDAVVGTVKHQALSFWYPVQTKCDLNQQF
jgi:hypothetical protein